MPGLKPPPGYHTLAETGERLMALAQGGLGRLFVLGHSVRGRPIWGFHLGPGREQAPQVMIQAQIHANEWIGTQLCLALLEHFAAQPPRLATGLWVLPGVNPDGFERNLRRLGHDLMALGRKNAHGVDLNRNFPVGFYHRDKGFFSGSKNALSPY